MRVSTQDRAQATTLPAGNDLLNNDRKSHE
jgi:hypothetical protein